MGFINLEKVIMKLLSLNFATGTILATALSVLFSLNVKADTIAGVYLSAEIWQPDISGEISNIGPEIDLEGDLNITETNSNQFSLSLEHLIVALPNIKVQKTKLNTYASSTLQRDISFGEVTFLAHDRVASQINLSHRDYIMYYEILDNWISVDLGLSVMKFKGNINLMSNDLSTKVKLSEYVPAIYGKASFQVPKKGLTFGIEGSALSLGDDSIADYKLFLGWEGKGPFGTEIGFRHFTSDWNDFDQSNGDVSFNGLYASVTFHL